ncbi:MAG: hypothetical protein EBV86_12465, partial [Marivivens sp.]|nr:hypothetical protein [Marivivens sp.]
DGLGFTVTPLATLTDGGQTYTSVNYVLTNPSTNQQISVSGGVSSGSVSADNSVSAGLTYPESNAVVSITLQVAGGDPVTITSSEDVYSIETKLGNLLRDNENTLLTLGYRLNDNRVIGTTYDEYGNTTSYGKLCQMLIRDDGRAFDISVSDNIKPLLQYTTQSDLVGAGTYTWYDLAAVQGSAVIDNGVTDRAGELIGTVQTTTVASTITEGTDSIGEVQQIQLTASGNRAGGNFKFGDVTFSNDLSVGAWINGTLVGNFNQPTVGHWGRLVADINQSLIGASFGQGTVPIATLSDPSVIRTDPNGGSETVSLDFHWGSRIEIFDISSYKYRSDEVVTAHPVRLELSNVDGTGAITVEASAPVYDPTGDSYYWLADMAHALNKELPDGSPYRFSTNLEYPGQSLIVSRVDGAAFKVSGVESLATDQDYEAIRQMNSQSVSTTYDSSYDGLRTSGLFTDSELDKPFGIFVISYGPSASPLWVNVTVDADPTPGELADAIKAALNGQTAGQVTHVDVETVNGEQQINIIWATAKPEYVAMRVPAADGQRSEGAATESYGAIDYIVNVAEHTTSVTGASAIFDFEIDQTAASTPTVSATGGSDSLDDLTLSVDAGDDVSVAITGAAPGEYVYLIEANQSTVLSRLTNEPQTALNELRGLSDELWSRSKVASDGSVDVTTAGLVGGVYKVVAMDLAGNFSQIADHTITVQNSSATSGDAFFDVMFKGINNDADAELDYTPGANSSAGTDGSEISSATVVLELNDLAVGDTVELWADDTKVFAHQVTVAEVAAGELTFGLYDFSDADATTNGRAADKVELALKVMHGDQYVEDGDVTWDYQW